MPLRDFECTECHEILANVLVRSQDDEVLKCPKCECTVLQMLLSSHSQYKIKGNNSASVTPKKFRGER